MWRRFLKFDGNAGKPVYVNSEAVAFVKPLRKDASAIHFIGSAKDEYVGVKHPADEVAESLLRGRRVKRA